MKSLSRLFAPLDPASALELTTKQYVDDRTSFEKLMLELGLAVVLTASETLAAGSVVFADVSNDDVYLASADFAVARPCNGYVTEAVTSGNAATVYFAGTPALQKGISGFTVADNVYLSTTAGYVTAAPPSPKVGFTQHVGVTLYSASGFLFVVSVRFSPGEWA